MPSHLVKVLVTPKKSVLDPQGKAVLSGLHALGYDAVQAVRAGKYIEVTVEAETSARAAELGQDMCEKLLANTVIEEYQVVVEEP